MRNKDRKGDVIFVNGEVITVDKNNNVNEALVISDNIIAYTGTNEEALQYKTDNTEVIDLNGRSLVPGFIDSHIHVAHTGAWKSVLVNLDPSVAPTIPDMMNLIKKKASETPNGEWVACWGFDEDRLPEKRMPTISELDDASPDNPVMCARLDGHTGVYNSLALKIGGINKETASNYVKGQVEIIDDQISGVLRETAYYDMWNYVHLPMDELIKGLKIESDDLIKAGVTSVHDTGSYGSMVHVAYHEAVKKNIFKPRVLVMHFSLLGKESVKKSIKQYAKDGYGCYMGNDKIKYGLMKIMIDGGSSGPSCAMKKGYTHDPENTGIMSMSQEEIDDIVWTIHSSDLQATAHAVGDKAIEAWVSAIEKAQAKYPRKDPRHRIEHCGFVDDDLLKRIKDLGIIPIPNPRFIHLNGDRYLRFFGDRVHRMFPMKTFLDNDVICAIGTDCSIIPENPFLGLASSMNRLSSSGEEVGGCQKIDIMDAIRMYTYNGAYAEKAEDIKGSLEPGKLADMVVVSDKMLSATAEQVEAMKCQITVIDGQIVYRADI